jgi:5'-nucleotidase
MLKLLISNDDGVLAKGLLVLREKLASIAQITVIAPEVDCSGTSSSLTLGNPLRITELDSHYYALRGTPTDCVHAAISGLLPELPDMVITGINNRSNLGDDIIYSGTFAAAYEGRNLRFPAISLSMVSVSSEPHYETGAQVCIDLIETFLNHPFEHCGVLNVNIPDVPYHALKGIKITHLGRRDSPNPIEEGVDPRGNPYFWLGARGKAMDSNDEFSDFYAVMNGYASVSPVNLDLTCYRTFEKLTQLKF